MKSVPELAVFLSEILLLLNVNLSDLQRQRTICIYLHLFAEGSRVTRQPHHQHQYPLPEPYRHLKKHHPENLHSEWNPD